MASARLPLDSRSFSFGNAGSKIMFSQAVVLSSLPGAWNHSLPIAAAARVSITLIPGVVGGDDSDDSVLRGPYHHVAVAVPEIYGQ
jgi:hypothetical protein